MDISGKSVLVTGGASGIGEACARRFAKAGAKVAILDMNEEQGRKVASEIGGTFTRANVSDEGEVKAAVDEAVTKHGGLHVCLNIAGVGSAEKTYGKNGPASLENFRRVIEINLIGTFNVARLCAEAMAGQEPVTEDGQRGIIVNTASVAAFDGQVGQAAYSASKGAVVGMTLPMARDLSQLGIRVATIAPGLVHTPLFDGLRSANPEMFESLSNSVLNPRRLGKPDEIASTAQWIVENDYVNGETIRVDGGIRMQPR
jgi:NAD(P)-dependent dehydrogenase (short-subunit alcohol dehydrogenase family)